MTKKIRQQAKPIPGLTKGDSPVDFLWGVFCRHVLKEDQTKENSLIGILPTIIAQADIDIESLPAEAPETFGVEVGNLSVWALFARRSGIEGSFSVEFDITVSICGHEGTHKASLQFEEHHQFGQLSFKLLPNGIPVPTKEGVHKLKCSAAYSVLGEKLGIIELPMIFTVKHKK